MRIRLEFAIGTVRKKSKENRHRLLKLDREKNE